MIFDGSNKLIVLESGDGLTLSVRNLWSRWVDWVATADNSKYAYAFDQVGGQSIDPSAGTQIPIYVFLKNGWRLRPKEASHTLTVNDGVLLVDGGGDPFVATVGSYTVRINYSQPVQAISFATSNAVTPAAVADAVWAASDGGDSTMGSTLTGLIGKVFDGPPEISPSISLKDAIRLLLSVSVGKATGGNTTSIHFRDVEDTKDSVTMTVDSSGNRSSVTLNP